MGEFISNKHSPVTDSFSIYSLRTCNACELYTVNQQFTTPLVHQPECLSFLSKPVFQTLPEACVLARELTVQPTADCAEDFWTVPKEVMPAGCGRMEASMSLSVLEVVSQEDLKVRIETQKRQQTQMRLKGNVLSRLDQAFDAVYELFEEHGDSFLPGAKQKITRALNAAEQAVERSHF